jgi:8-oxo-dGTP diphosphatase
MSASPHFNIRVYGILFNEQDEVLISDEFRFNHSFTKFPGGGLEFGEGLKDALKREFLEEFQLEINVGELFYVNDFLQISAFSPDSQLFSFYFFIESKNTFEANRIVPILTEEGEQARWIKIRDLSSETMTFPIDKLVAMKLREKE